MKNTLVAIERAHPVSNATKRPDADPVMADKFMALGLHRILG